jgi:serine/threonine-protein kinase
VSKAGFWRTDAFLGLAVAVGLFVLALSTDLVARVERSAYDMGVRATNRTPSDRIAVIAIDDASVRNIGRWPWPRDVHARMTETLATGKAKVIASLVFFAEPQVDRGLAYVSRLADEYRKAVSEPAAVEQGSPLAQMGAILEEAEAALNTDRKLAESYAKAGNVLLPMLFEVGVARGKPDRSLPESVTRNALKNVQGSSPDAPLQTTADVVVPMELLGKHSAGIGYLNTRPDIDGSIRTEPLVLGHFGQLFPSLALLIAARSFSLGPDDIKVTLGEGVNLASLRITTDPRLLMHTFFYKDRDGRPPFAVDSFFDVYSGRIPADRYKDKIVLIGPTAPGLGTTLITPVSAETQPVLALAHSVSSILQAHFLVAPAWGGWAELAAYLLVAAYLVAVLPRLTAGTGTAVTAVLLAAVVATHFGLMTAKSWWLQLMLPAVLLVLGHVALTAKRFLVTERGKEKSEAESVASNRMLGLAFQGQGQLDMAFDYFRKCPVDDTLLDNLYNLALDFERKRQFNKADNVFRYIAERNPKFRDGGEEVSRAKQRAETGILGGDAARTTTVVLAADAVEKPMLGRYQIERELGKGAMGVVYQGKDPKIGRIVAIKTMAFAREFEADELADVMARFFREAETAGRLNHPNIVTIFDAGEERELAYIAMEFLKGQDLLPYTKPGQLLPPEKVVSIIARVADALGYAHRQNVVHRDIKPANIMYEPQTDTVKVTDFGIARITDASKTRTGMVLGTPSYMSPEQLAGKKIDGRSDLFSLGASLYQLLSGRLPFEGESMAQLMYKIANEPAPDILQFNARVPPALVAFLSRAMAKEPGERFQTGEEFAQALRACMGARRVQKRDVDISL